MVNYLNFLKQIGDCAKNKTLKKEIFIKEAKSRESCSKLDLEQLYCQMKSIEEVKRNDYLYFIKGFDKLNKGVVPFAHFISSLNVSGLILDKNQED